MLKRIEGRIGKSKEFVEFQKKGSNVTFIAQNSMHNQNMPITLWYVYRNVRGTGNPVSTIDFSYHKDIAVDKALKAAIVELES